MPHSGFLDGKLNQKLNRWSQTENFMQTLIEKILNESCFIAPVATFVQQRVIIVANKDINRETPVMKMISSPSNRFPSASAGTISGDEANARRSSREWLDPKHWRHRDTSVKSRNKCRKHQYAMFSSPQTDGGLNIPNFKSLGPSSRSCFGSSYLDRCNRCARRDDVRMEVTYT